MNRDRSRCWAHRTADCTPHQPSQAPHTHVLEVHCRSAWLQEGGDGGEGGGEGGGLMLSTGTVPLVSGLGGTGA